MVVNYHIKKRNYLFRTFVQLPREPALNKPGGGNNIEMRDHINVGRWIRYSARAYLFTKLHYSVVYRSIYIRLKKALETIPADRVECAETDCAVSFNIMKQLQ